MIQLILGGSASGKSFYAEQEVLSLAAGTDAGKCCGGKIIRDIVMLGEGLTHLVMVSCSVRCVSALCWPVRLQRGF